uniref:Phosphoglycerate mutase family protein n=1 Tax=Caenorhabditis tropicalis TaxID=1561998 RepID=A0A1I7T5E4_9PELO
MNQSKKQRKSLELDEENESSANYLRSEWNVCIKSAKVLKKVTVVMRSAERVDRVFGSGWVQSEKYMTKVYSTDVNVPKRAVLHPHHYHFNPPITNMGKYTSQLLARALRNRGIEPAVIFCSPTLRCLQTAAAIAKSTGARILVEPGLLEPLEWYRKAGAKQLPDFFDEVFDFPQIDKTYKPIFSMHEFTSMFEVKSQEQCIQRIMLVVKNICVIPRDSPALIVGHAVTMDVASRIGQHGDTLSVENIEDLTSYEDSTYPSDPSGQAAKLEMGVRYPPSSVMALIRNNDAPPHVLKTVPDLVPPLTVGSFSNRITN